MTCKVRSIQRYIENKNWIDSMVYYILGSVLVNVCKFASLACHSIAQLHINWNPYNCERNPNENMWMKPIIGGGGGTNTRASAFKNSHKHVSMVMNESEWEKERQNISNRVLHIGGSNWFCCSVNSINTNTIKLVPIKNIYRFFGFFLLVSKAYETFRRLEFTANVRNLSMP